VFYVHSNRLILEFTAIAYFFALIVDVVFYIAGLAPGYIGGTTSVLVALWGFMRMWSVALTVSICLLLHGVSVKSWLSSKLSFKRKVILYYFTAPLIIYFALGVYVAIAYPLGLFDFNAYVDVIREYLSSTSLGGRVRDVAWIIAIAQIIQAYIAAVTVNALAALGEEIGWRGYLFELLGGATSLKKTVIIGVLWGLWHAPAILLMGYNYAYNRLLGVLLFTALTVVITYPHLYVTGNSGSLWPPSSLHGGINALWNLTLIASRLPMEQREILLGLGAIGILAWMVTDFTIIILSKAVKRRSRTANRLCTQ